MIFDSGLTGLLLLCAAVSCSSTNTVMNLSQNVTFCPYINPQKILNWTQIIRKWYVVEVMKHSIPVQPISNNYIVLDSCPIVKLRNADGDNSPDNIRLLWTEETGDLEYSFAVTSPDEPGRWIPKGTQNGTLVTQKYPQFEGVVQIIRAVETYMVLTFCSTRADNDKYTFVLSKDRYLPENETEHIRGLLLWRGLTIATIQKTCNNSGNRKELDNTLRWITLLVAIAATAGQVFTTSSEKMRTLIIDDQFANFLLTSTTRSAN